MLEGVSRAVTMSIARALEHDAVITTAAAAAIVRILFYLPQYLQTYRHS